MSSRIEYYGKSGQHLKYSVCKPDGTPKGAPLHLLLESQTPGYYTTISHTNLEKDDKIVIYGPENILYEGEPLTYEGDFVTVDETVGKGEFSAIAKDLASTKQKGEKMNKSKEANQTEEQQLAVRIIRDLKIWTRWSPDLTTSPKRLLFRLGINNNLEIDPIIQKLELEGKDGAAKRIEYLRDTVIKDVKKYQESAKPYLQSNTVLLPSDEMKRDALRFIEVLERAIPYLGSNPSKDRIQANLTSTKQNGGKAKLLQAKGFTFNEAQAFYKGRDLKLPTNKPIRILEILAKSIGQVVPYSKLDSESTNSNASDSLRGDIVIIRAAFKRLKIPFRVDAKRGFGYLLNKSR